MSQMRDAYTALNRFGFGARPGDIEHVLNSGGAQGWLRDQVRLGAVFAKDLDGQYRSSDDFLAEFQTTQLKKDQKLTQEIRKKQRQEFNDEMLARFDQATKSKVPFAERLVHFWSNHFTVSGQGKAIIVGMLGAYEREAIRPNVFRRFEDMLIAVETHPAMLIYLDNHQSVGPNSIAGRRRNRGLNENLAREIMELHTLGVNGGYTQRDVTELAKIITGWSIRGAKQDGKAGFRFQHNTHEPGQKFVLGNRYGTNMEHKSAQQRAFKGAQEGKAVLRDLARHPSTAKFIATKLARHFISDHPPESAIRALEKTFLETYGDLPSVYETLIGLPELWREDFPKYRPPLDYLINVVRSSGLDIKEDQRLRNQISQAVNMMDHRPFMALSPAGWGDTESDWLSPDSLMNRIDWTHNFANRFLQHHNDPLGFAKQTIGSVASSSELTVIAQAPSKRDGYALTLLSPYVMRR